ncbi:UbiA family prenyltransferase [Streptomyces sp. DSM 42041]|uniref:UbiA family prenyltransferase n=1 Tax=Streptomyces hazeniae TaxID=3075538 RepID=A0ABU2NUB0_9ACTN|nr:UbiA family prenyltransferase [Streptomyces sp. DSM 42041]MDT0380092.1 UbiA family prenyltransferase [Streptomyces sp. DSM 42041]
MRAWAELLRVSALFSVPGDALAGAAAAGCRPGRGTALAVGTSLCLYEAGMALNDWSDREEDARERPGRPLPSGRVTPRAALTAAAALTGTGLGLAALTGRPALTTATALAGTVWAYDLGLKHTRAAPATMATARTLDLLLGALAAGRTPGGRGRRTPLREALRPALALGAHTLAVTTVSRHETTGGSSAPALRALATVAVLAGGIPGRSARGARATPRPYDRVLVAAATAAYLATAGRPLAHAALNPSPPLLQRAVGGGIRAMIPLQAALIARASGRHGTSGAGAVGVLALLPLARHLSRKVSPT